MVTSEERLHINIADIVIRFESAQQGTRFIVGEPYERFLSSDEPDVTLRWHCDFFPELRQVEEIFDPESFWKLQSADDCYILNYPSATLPRPDKPFKLVLFTRDFRKGDIFLHPDFAFSGDTVNPLTDRLDELLYMHLLGQGFGVSFHTCCVDYDGRGLLFLGHSGAGKSTMATLWEKHRPDTRILSDDRAIVRYVDGKYMVYGTPWHGTAEHALPDSVPLTEIYIIEHGESNSLQPLEGAQKVAEVMTRSLIPYWLYPDTEFSTTFIEQMLQTVSCQRLRFRPTEDVLKLLDA
ncbi:MAG: hypothetical protein GY800_04470 [Planctomycetes bacterium]|nr:hypothetical protein [Planctomycetota bacterium]